MDGVHAQKGTKGNDGKWQMARRVAMTSTRPRPLGDAACLSVARKQTSEQAMCCDCCCCCYCCWNSLESSELCLCPVRESRRMRLLGDELQHYDSTIALVDCG